MNLIAAADEAWGIGKDGGLLAHLPGDMKYFRETTQGKVVVMGRKTLESFPGGKPLKNRTNIVLTRNGAYQPEGVRVCRSRGEALEALKEFPPEDVFVIGGGEIYRGLLPYCSRAYVTHIFHDFKADTYLPDLDSDPDWRLSGTGERREDGGIAYEFRVYERCAGFAQ